MNLQYHPEDYFAYDYFADEDQEQGLLEYNWHCPLPDGHPSRKTMLDLGFIENLNQPVCLICGEIDWFDSCEGEPNEVYEPAIDGYRAEYPVPIPRSKRRINWKEGF